MDGMRRSGTSFAAWSLSRIRYGVLAPAGASVPVVVGGSFVAITAAVLTVLTSAWVTVRLGEMTAETAGPTQG